MVKYRPKWVELGLYELLTYS